MYVEPIQQSTLQLTLSQFCQWHPHPSNRRFVYCVRKESIDTDRALKRWTERSRCRWCVESDSWLAGRTGCSCNACHKVKCGFFTG